MSTVSLKPESGITVSGLSISVFTQSTDIVDAVSFRVPAGTTLGLVGESGSGKTSVAMALLGYARPGLTIRAGAVDINSEDVLALSGAKLRRLRGSHVAYVPQDPGAALNPALKVGVQLSELVRAHGVDKTTGAARIEQVLNDVGLGGVPVCERYAHQLSGGQQQRVMLAMAFALEPAAIVLDEPTTGLDVSTQRRILEVIAGMCESRNVAGIFVSHDLTVVGSLVDQVAVLYAGQIVEIGTTAAVFSSPSHPYTRALLNAVPKLDTLTSLTGLEGQPPSPGEWPHGCRFAPRCPFAKPKCSASPLPFTGDPGGRLVRCIRVEELPAFSPSGKQRSETPSGEESGRSLLRVKGITASYGDSPVLHDVDFDLDSGECLAIVGESGSGKTTLARCVVGLHRTYSGDIYLETDKLSASAKSRSVGSLQALQYVFQNPFSSLNPRKSVKDLIEQPVTKFFDYDQAETKRRIAIALESASLSSRFLPRFPRELSGGERQRVAIARALVVNPRVLVCDEITSALDVSVQAAVVETLYRLQSEHNLALLFITHDLALVRSIAQRAIVLEHGRIVEQGDCARVFEHPQHAYTQALIRDLPQALTQAQVYGSI
jgi:peptide/nickel transport system ATP-binding protein